MSFETNATNPPGYDGQPVRLHHFSIGTARHNNDSTLVLAACAPVWFNPDLKSDVGTLIICPACARIMAGKVEPKPQEKHGV